MRDKRSLSLSFSLPFLLVLAAFASLEIASLLKAVSAARGEAAPSSDRG